MKQLLEMILSQLQQLVTYVTEQLDKVQQTEADERYAAVGKAFLEALKDAPKVRGLYAIRQDFDGLTLDEVAGVVGSLEDWEEELGEYDRDSLKKVYDAVANVLMDPEDEIEDFMSESADAVKLYKRICDETDVDPSDDDEVINVINSSVSDDDKSQIRDAVDTIREITRNW